MGTKKFDKELYKKADPLSNGIMGEWLKKHGYECIDLEETYGVDREGSQGTLTFVQFRKDCKQAWFMDGQVVRDAPIKTINTKYTTNEKFYCIDVNDAYIINMENIDVPKNLINRKYPS